MASKEESQNIGEELHDGPPPGWLPLPQVKEEKEDHEVGPQPGLQWISVKEVTGGDTIPVNEEGEEEDGPPPGWESVPVQVEEEPGRKSTRLSDEEGPKPGRQSVHENEEDGAPPGRQSEPVREGAAEDRRPLCRQFVPPPKRPPPIPAPQSRTPLPRPPPSAATSEKAQMVCGSCHQLLSYPRGSKYVQCGFCQTVNLVLEEHQVGQVKCGSCAVLLMYPYGAQSVKCSSCRGVTEIGVHNKRPPLSIQQGRPPPRPNPVH